MTINVEQRNYMLQLSCNGKLMNTEWSVVYKNFSHNLSILNVWITNNQSKDLCIKAKLLMLA